MHFCSSPVAHGPPPLGRSVQALAWELRGSGLLPPPCGDPRRGRPDKPPHGRAPSAGCLAEGTRVCGGPQVWSTARLSPCRRGQGGGGTGGTLQRGEKQARGLKFQQRKMLGTNRKYCFLARQSFVRTAEIMFSRCAALPSRLQLPKWWWRSWGERVRAK